MPISLGAGAMALWMALAGFYPVVHDVVPGRVDSRAQSVVEQYLTGLPAPSDVANQGIWFQSDKAVLAHHQGTAMLPVASLTKVATSLAALRTWRPNHQFITLVDATGPINSQGVLQGDLVIQAEGDPFFVMEDALAVAQALSQLGLREVTGRLLISGEFYMNFTTNSARSGQLLKQVLSPAIARAGKGRGRSKAPVEEVSVTSARHPIMIRGPVEVVVTPPERRVALVQHRSLPLTQILKRMNVYSNNAMANMVTTAVGGPSHMLRQAVTAAGLTANEVQLINGSGLGPENQISPRGVCAMFRAIQDILRSDRLTVADIFPVAGYDLGTIRRRQLPFFSVVKTGTLRNVSSLAGVILTRAHGPVWFAIVNRGGNLNGFRLQQDELLQRLLESWELADPPPADFVPKNTLSKTSRDDIVLRPRLGGG